MRRREFIIFFGGVAVGWPRSVCAQQSTKLPRIGDASPNFALNVCTNLTVRPFRRGYQTYFAARAITTAERTTSGAICIQKETTVLVT